MTSSTLISPASLDRHRYDLVRGTCWWESCYRDTRVRMAAAGWRVCDFQFPGLVPPGDGVTFTGTCKSVETFLGVLGIQCPMIVALCNRGGLINLRLHRGRDRYPTYNSVYASVVGDTFTDIVRSQQCSALLRASVEVWNNKLEEEQCILEDATDEYMHQAMQELYQALAARYLYLTSNEAVTEYILGSTTTCSTVTRESKRSLRKRGAKPMGAR